MRATATGGGRRVAALGVAAAAIILGGAGEGDWPSFRGAGGAGVADGGPTVTTWNVETGEHVRWKTPIPGLAHSSPVIAGDRLFVTTAVREGDSAELTVGLYGDIRPVDDEGMHAFKVYCLDRATGAIRWERTAIEAVPKIKRHPKGSHAASSPATDGRFVVAFFGSEGLYCYDVDGDLKWSKDLGVLDSGFYMVPDAQWGFASSPIIHGDMVILQCDVQKDSFLAALKLETGEELWRTPRDEVPTWATPTVDVRPDRKQVICNGWKHIGGYDLETGEALWSLRGGGDIPVPRPVVAHDLVYITPASPGCTGGAATTCRRRSSSAT
jgi:outer membrane protein assembly factor BamB